MKENEVARIKAIENERREQDKKVDLVSFQNESNRKQSVELKKEEKKEISSSSEGQLDDLISAIRTGKAFFKDAAMKKMPKKEEKIETKILSAQPNNKTK